jgi:hypothetical protein
MTVTDLPRTTTPTPESENLARLWAMLDDPAERDNWPEIDQAIVYLTATTALGAS